MEIEKEFEEVEKGYYEKPRIVRSEILSSIDKNLKKDKSKRMDVDGSIENLKFNRSCDAFNERPRIDISEILASESEMMNLNQSNKTSFERKLIRETDLNIKINGKKNNYIIEVSVNCDCETIYIKYFFNLEKRFDDSIAKGVYDIDLILTKVDEEESLFKGKFTTNGSKAVFGHTYEYAFFECVFKKI